MEYPPGFLKAWKAYPHYQTRSGKARSFARWKTRHLESKTENVLAWIEAKRRSEDWSKAGGKYVPAMEVWLLSPDFSEAPPEMPPGGSVWPPPGSEDDDALWVEYCRLRRSGALGESPEGYLDWKKGQVKAD